jgi:hypothetical protein
MEMHYHSSGFHVKTEPLMNLYYQTQMLYHLKRMQDLFVSMNLFFPPAALLIATSLKENHCFAC